MDDWEVSLDRSPGDAAPSPGPSARLAPLLALAACALLAVGFLVWHPQPELRTTKPTVPTVLGQQLVAPVRLTTPRGVVAVADRAYIGLQYAAEGSMLVTVPDEVVQPGGLRSALPADPVSWIEHHPDVFVSRVREVTVAGRTVTQLDYRRSRNALPQSQFARLPLFCTGDADCTRITANARVRATFVPVGGRTVIVEAVWRIDDSTPETRLAGRLMPTGLATAYTQLLASLTPRP